MRKSKYNIVMSSQFDRDYKLAKKRHYKIKLLEDVVTLLSDGNKLPRKYKDHALSGIWSGYRECHIQPDWLLVYRIEKEMLVLVLSRTGTHSDIFK